MHSWRWWALLVLEVLVLLALVTAAGTDLPDMSEDDSVLALVVGFIVRFVMGWSAGKCFMPLCMSLNKRIEKKLESRKDARDGLE